MTSKERFLAALAGTKPDRLPVTTHHVMPYFLKNCLQGMDQQEFFEAFGLDAITWSVPHRPAPGSRDFADPLQGEPGFLESRRVANDCWRVFGEESALRWVVGKYGQKQSP